MNALERRAAEIIAQYLHEQDPRFVWAVIPASETPDRSVRAAGDETDQPLDDESEA